MATGKKKKILLILLLAVTLVLAGVAVYFGYKLSQETTDDTSVGAGCAGQQLSSSQFVLSGDDCDKASIRTYQRPYSGTSDMGYDFCVTDDSNGSLISDTYGGESTYTAAGACLCTQIDAIYGDKLIAAACHCGACPVEPTYLTVAAQAWCVEGEDRYPMPGVRIRFISLDESKWWQYRTKCDDDNNCTVATATLNYH